MWRTALLLTVIVTAACCGCTAHHTVSAVWVGPPAEAVERLECYHVISNTMAGTGVHIGDNRLWLSAHLLGELPAIEVDGEATGYTVVDHGPDGDTFVEDWVVIRPYDVKLTSRSVLEDWDPNRPAPDGTHMIIKGFYSAVPRTRLALHELGPTVFEAVVKTPPWGRSRELIYLEAPARHSYPGISGGGAYEWDADSGRFYFHGICQGVQKYDVLGVRAGIRLIVRRPPWSEAP